MTIARSRHPRVASPRPRGRGHGRGSSPYPVWRGPVAPRRPLGTHAHADVGRPPGTPPLEPMRCRRPLVGCSEASPCRRPTLAGRMAPRGPHHDAGENRGVLATGAARMGAPCTCLGMPPHGLRRMGCNSCSVSRSLETQTSRERGSSRGSTAEMLSMSRVNDLMDRRRGQGTPRPGRPFAGDIPGRRGRIPAPRQRSR